MLHSNSVYYYYIWSSCYDLTALPVLLVYSMNSSSAFKVSFTLSLPYHQLLPLFSVLSSISVMELSCAITLFSCTITLFSYAVTPFRYAVLLLFNPTRFQLDVRGLELVAHQLVGLQPVFTPVLELTFGERAMYLIGQY